MNIDVLFQIVYWAWVATEILLQWIKPTRSGGGAVRDRGSLYVLLTAIFGSIWFAMQYGAMHAPTLPGRPMVLHITALVLVSVGLALRWAAVITLGNAFSTNVAIRSEQKLKRSGLYAWARHPSYSAMLIIFVGIGINTRNWISLAAVVAVPFAALLYRIHVEERALNEAFDEYAEYSRSTRRLIPGIY